MMDPMALGTAAAAAVAALVGVAKSYHNGALGAALEEREAARQATPEIQQTLQEVATDVEHTRTKVDDIDDRVDEVARSMVIIHSDANGQPDIDEAELRERLDVDRVDDDLVEQSG